MTGGRALRILFLHGWQSTPGGVKPVWLADHGHEVLNPALDDDDFEAALRTAELIFRQSPPDVIVGSSRGGAVAMNMQAVGVPCVLLCPARRTYGTADRLAPRSLVLHSRHDDVVPFADSEELIRRSGCSPGTLIETGHDHRLADRDSLQTMLAACKRFGSA